MKRLADRKLRNHAHQIAATFRRINKRLGKSDTYAQNLRMLRNRLGF